MDRGAFTSTPETFQRLLVENRELRARVEQLEAVLQGDGRCPPPPAFVKPNVKKDPAERK